MAFATVADVQQLNTARTYTGSSNPNASQVIDFLEQTAGELDGILRAQGYTLPVATTATSALKALEHYNALGAAAMVEQGAKTSPESKRENAMKLWESAKKMLREGMVELDAPRNLDAAAPRAPAAASPWFSRDLEF